VLRKGLRLSTVFLPEKYSIKRSMFAVKRGVWAFENLSKENILRNFFFKKKKKSAPGATFDRFTA
jgi:hypothetical protein